jgi:Fe-S cluster assembly ATPase SufC
MGILKPKFIILDEIDSGLDVDALKVVSNFINEYYKTFKPTILIITHHTNIIKYIKPNYVHILDNGKIVKTGDYHLAESEAINKEASEYVHPYYVNNGRGLESPPKADSFDDGFFE